MHCFDCVNDLSSDNYAVVEGIHFCLTCFIDRHRKLSRRQRTSHSPVALSQFLSETTS